MTIDPNTLFLIVIGGPIVVLWLLTILACIDVLRRNDLKEDKVLWVLVLLFTYPLGLILYTMYEGRRAAGVVSIALALIMGIIGILFWIAMAAG